MWKHRIIYLILWLLTFIAYSIPWASVDGQSYTGWNFTIPFSITYVIGIVLGLVVLILRFKPVMLTLVAGILMLLGVVGAGVGHEIGAVLAGLIGKTSRFEAGIGFAFLISVIFTIAGAYVGKKMVAKKAPRLGSGGAILEPITVSSQMICKNCGAENPLKTEICRACGVPLYEELPGRRCPVCNAPLKLASILSPGRIMCNVCYSEFQLVSVPRAYQPTLGEDHFPKKPRFGRKTKIAITGVAVFLLFLIIAGFSVSTQRQTVTTTQTFARGSLSNPALVGESVTVKAYGSVFEITVLDFIRGEEAREEIETANLFNPSPDEGYEYVLVKVRVKYIKGDDTATVGIFDFKAFVKGSGYGPKLFGVVYPQNKPEFKSVTLVPGGASEGWILFEVPKDDEILISFSYLFSEPLCFIKLVKTS
jgi:predicted RNA-binding Zn-ribbon protein involved in translation (DUF1610 family)